MRHSPRGIGRRCLWIVSAGFLSLCVRSSSSDEPLPVRPLWLAQDLGDDLVGFVALGVGEVVVAFGVADGEVGFGTVELEDGGGGGGDAVHAVPFEVGVFHGCIHEDAARCEGGDELVVVEGHLLRVAEVVAHSEHVALLHPAFEVAAVVVEDGVKAATGDDDLQTGVEQGGEDAVMPAEGVADGGKAVVFFDFGHGLEEIDAADVVPDGFHGAAGEAEGLEVWLIVREEWVAGGEGDVAALGELGGVLTMGLSAEADDDFVADFVFRGVQAEHGGNGFSGERCFR